MLQMEQVSHSTAGGTGEYKGVTCESGECHGATCDASECHSATFDAGEHHNATSGSKKHPFSLEDGATSMRVLRALSLGVKSNTIKRYKENQDLGTTVQFP